MRQQDSSRPPATLAARRSAAIARWRGCGSGRAAADRADGRAGEGLHTRRVRSRAGRSPLATRSPSPSPCCCPSGKPLTQYRTGSGPHTGVHLIIVRDDLAYIIHQHPPIGPNGLLRQTVTFPAPGPYRVLVDVYPNIPGGQPNFQLFQDDQRHRVTTGRCRCRRSTRDLVVDGYHFDMQGHPQLHAIQAQFIHVDVTDSHGAQAHVRPVVRRARARDLLPAGIARLLPHAHLRAERAELRRACRASRAIANHRAVRPRPASCTIGVLLPVPGTWRLFLQMKLGGRIVTAPYTLNVKP